MFALSTLIIKSVLAQKWNEFRISLIKSNHKKEKKIRMLPYLCLHIGGGWLYWVGIINCFGFRSPISLLA